MRYLPQFSTLGSSKLTSKCTTHAISRTIFKIGTATQYWSTSSDEYVVNVRVSECAEIGGVLPLQAL